VLLLVYLDLAMGVAWFLLERGFRPLALRFMGFSSALTSTLLLAGAFAPFDPWLPLPEEDRACDVYEPVGRVIGPGRAIAPTADSPWGWPGRP
jgi:hypothetical protein